MDQSNNPTQIQLVKAVSFFGFPTGAWVTPKNLYHCKVILQHDVHISTALWMESLLLSVNDPLPIKLQPAETIFSWGRTVFPGVGTQEDVPAVTSGEALMICPLSPPLRESCG